MGRNKYEFRYRDVTSEIQKIHSINIRVYCSLKSWFRKDPKPVGVYSSMEQKLHTFLFIMNALCLIKFRLDLYN